MALLDDLHIPLGVYDGAMEQIKRPLFLFDGDCGVCQNGTDKIREKVRPPVDICSYQSINLDEYEVSESDVLEGPVLVRTDGTHVVGPLAMAEMLASARAPYKFIGRFLMAPGVSNILRAVGPSMYRNRSYLPGANDSCHISQ